MPIQKNDFIEISFTGKIANTSEIFDTNILEDAKSAGFKTTNIKPFILSVGHKMLPAGFDNDLIGKEVEKNYKVTLNPKEAFGERNSQLVRMIPAKHFHEQKISPVRGMQISLDGQLVKVLSSDRGRTLVDFNNPLAGKKVTYIYKINKIITDQRQKINALQEFLFRQTFDFEIHGKTITFIVPRQAEQFIKMFSPKFEEILALKIETKTIAENKK
ncbi:FKBP-type peptidyl-prolyl cis-trans isomerase [Candidatus Pacearchaeota archaeon]|nr:FKBP-type peptidyl-prolyl cis-trans isomerase [Candidatus Pacearchaeota archaeon]